MGGAAWVDQFDDNKAITSDGKHFYFIQYWFNDTLTYSSIKYYNVDSDTTVILDSLSYISNLPSLHQFNGFRLMENETKIFAFSFDSKSNIMYYIYDLTERKRSIIETQIYGNKIIVSSLANYIAAIMKANEIHILDNKANKKAVLRLDSEKKIMDIRFSNNDKLMAIILNDSVYVYETGSFLLFSSFFLSNFQNDRFKIDMEGDKLLKFLNDGYVLIYDLKTGKNLGYFNINTEGDRIRGVQLTKENYLLVFKSKTEVWDINTKKKIFEFDRIDENSVVSMGTSLVVSGRNKLELWDYNKGILVKAFLSFYSRGSFICNNRYLSVSDESGFQWYLLNASNLEEIGKVNNSYSFHSSCNYINYKAGNDNSTNSEYTSIKILDFPSGVSSDSFSFPKIYKNYFFSNDLQYIYLIDYSNELSLWNWPSKKIIYSFQIDSFVKFIPSQTSKYFLIKQFIGNDYQYNVYETITGKLVYNFKNVPSHPFYISYFRWATDKDYLYSDWETIENRTITLYAIPTGEIVKKYKIPDFLNNESGNWIIMGDYNKIAFFEKSNTKSKYIINIQSLETNEIIYSTEVEYFFPVKSIFFSSDMKYLLISFHDGSLLLRETEISSVKNLISVENSFFISPNPAGEYIVISGLNKGLQPLVPEQEIKIFNLLGECVMSASGAGGTHPLIPSREGNIRIDVSGLPAGVYFIRVGDWVGRFLKI
jgi:hypothetical protein